MQPAVFIFCIAMIAAAASSLFGYSGVARPWVTEPPNADQLAEAETFWSYRAPRTALGVFVGAGLALGGMVFQSLFRNPLATPYTFGVASAAALAAATAYLLGDAIFPAILGDAWRATRLAGFDPIGFVALLGAAGAIAFVITLSRTAFGRDTTQMLLVGVCIAYFSGAGILAVNYFANQAVTNAIVLWMMGALSRHDPTAWQRVAILFLPAALFALSRHRDYDLLLFGGSLAATRGVSVTFVLYASFILIGLLTGVIVAHCGPIGFVGLMAPHMARSFVGPRALPLMIASCGLGAAFLTVADAIARSALPGELPVGVLTNGLGAVFFFTLLLRGAGRAR